MKKTDSEKHQLSLVANPLALAGTAEPLVKTGGPSARTGEPSARTKEPSARIRGQSATKQKASAETQEPLADKQEPLANKQEPLANKQEPLANKQKSLANTQEPAADSVAHHKQHGPLWYALHFPQLGELADSIQQQYLQQLAQATLAISSTISLQPQSLVCEIASSLRYFGGIAALHRTIAPAIRQQLTHWQLAEHFHYAASPTASASLLLAKSGHRGIAIYRQEQLRSSLGRLPTSMLQLNKEQRRRLQNMGIHYCRDLWRLPDDGLRKRFGSELVNYLQQLLGNNPEPMARYQPAAEFSSTYQLPFQIETTALLMPVLSELTAELCDFLRRRDLTVSQLVFLLQHEQQNSTTIALNLRQPSRCQQQLLLLLDTHLNYLSLAAPVIAVTVEVKRFDAFSSESEALLLQGKAEKRHRSDRQLDQFMEQLQARVGSNPVKSVNCVAEHRPEYASYLSNYDQSININREKNRKKNHRPVQPSKRPRPVWLLPQPVQLMRKHHGLYHQQRPIKLLSGPERIESGWWSGKDSRRDYYIAIDSRGMRLWIYREKTGPLNWYLHGLFA